MNVTLDILGIADLPFLVAIPLFTFAGYLLSESDAPKRLVRMTSSLLGWMPGGLAVVSLAACAFFTAFTGGSGVTIIALGAILYPALKQDGYPERFNLGLVTSSGSLGLLFAPSLPIILYGVVSEVPIDRLFLAGILPGMLMLLMLSAYSMWVNRGIRKPLATFSGREIGAAIRESAWEIPLPFVVLGGIYSGFLVVSEAAAITALYVFIVEVLVHREIPMARAAENYSLVDGPGRRHPDHSRCFDGLDQLHDQCGYSANAAGVGVEPGLEPDLVPGPAVTVPVGAGRDS